MNTIHPKSRQARRVSAHGRYAFLATVAALTLAAGGRASAATVLSASGDSHCGTSTCFDSHGTYAITFSAAAFGGPVDVSKLLLARSIFGNLDSHFFSLNFQLNGHQVGSWGNWNVSAIGGDELSFTGADLLWNPADGDLVLMLDLVAPNGEKLLPDGNGGWFITGGGGGGSAASPPAPDGEGSDQGSGGGFGDGYGQGSGDGSEVTVITYSPPNDESDGHSEFSTLSAAPEPATWALVLGGFGLAGLALRRRVTAASAA